MCNRHFNIHKFKTLIFIDKQVIKNVAKIKSFPIARENKEFMIIPDFTNICSFINTVTHHASDSSHLKYLTREIYELAVKGAMVRISPFPKVALTFLCGTMGHSTEPLWVSQGDWGGKYW